MVFITLLFYLILYTILNWLNKDLNFEQGSHKI
jgi:hypothetical protein